MVDNGEFLELTCRPKLIVKEGISGNDHIDLETIYDAQSHLALQISKTVQLPYQFPVLNKYTIVQDIWGYTGNQWTPGGLPAGDAYGKITFKDTNSGSTKEAHLFGIISTFADPYEYEPLLATDVGLVVQKDLAVGGYISTQQGEVWIGHGRDNLTDVPKIILMHTGSSYVGYPYDTLYLRKWNSSTGSTDESGNLDLGNLTIHGDTITITGNQEIHWDTYASSDWTNLGGFWFHNSYNGKSMEFKAIAHSYYGTLYPVMQMLYYDYNGANPVTIFQFDMNGTFEYAGYLVQMDYMDDIAALREIKTKKHENGTTIYDPDSLKFLQGQEGRYSLNACIGWELSIQRKFLREIDNLKLQIADLHSQLNTLKEDNPNNTVK